MCSTCGCGLSPEVEAAIAKAAEMMADALADALDMLPGEVRVNTLPPSGSGSVFKGEPLTSARSETQERVQLDVSFEKADINLKLGVIYGKASATRPDRQDDGIDLETMEQAAVDFMVLVNKGTGRATDTHDFGDIPGCWVASWIDADAGVWRVGFKPDDIEIAKAAYRGDFVGFSIGGMADRIMEDADTSRAEITLASKKERPASNRERLVPAGTAILKGARPSRDVVAAAVDKAVSRYRAQ